MAPPKNMPLRLRSSNTKIRRKKIEEMYQKQLEDILLRPDSYIGSMEKQTQNLWVYDQDGRMVHKPISYVPGLYKVFDEILVIAADNTHSGPEMDRLEVVIDQKENLISVHRTGNGIPVEQNEERIYFPELIFGNLDDDEMKTASGGAKLTNVFSTRFVIETADGKLKYKQVFTDNMGQKGEPEIKKCKANENWTKVTFHPDLAKFNMIDLEDDVVALMKKRVVDMAGCLASCPGKKVKVFLNGKEIEVKSFHDYAQLYLNTALPRIDNNTNPRWQITVTLSEGYFQQVSFVNRINTIKGGTHVDYITNQITEYVMEAVEKKMKNANLKQHNVKNYLWVFVNALIDNPAFDSQTKETLTTPADSFGSTCVLSDKFLERVVDESGVVESILSWANAKLAKDLKKSDGTKTRSILNVPKLEDAYEAGGTNSHLCTLILTEGDSAKALAMAGLPVVGRDYYGVFPLKGKLLNVRDASHEQITKNEEIIYLTKILGLKDGEKYDNEGSIKSLRYGHLMIMADQDHDGSHIKGLIINFFHTFWPELLRIPSFLVEFITPVVKATRGTGDREVIPFYTMPDYEDWVKSIVDDPQSWTIKYYKGLGTSDTKEAKQYFANLKTHTKSLVWEDDQDGEAIELAFSKKKIEERKVWLRDKEVRNVVDHKKDFVKYSDFVHKELKLFSREDLNRSIPSIFDGFKPTQRKVLFAAFKRTLINQIKVSQFSGYVSEHSAYHHGEESIQTTIVGMAQDFVGSNNINLFMPYGQFGTRSLGGKDAASPKYIYTKLSDITRYIFIKEDDLLLKYLQEDGLMVEPTWYMPIVPMVLVNGATGIGTGWSTFIPNHNPRDIIANIKNLLNGEPIKPMHPFYNKFKGTIRGDSGKEGVYIVTGKIEKINKNEDDEERSDDDVTLKITELPIRKWTQNYKEFLQSLLEPSDKYKEEGFIKEMKDYSTIDNVHFEVILSRKNFNLAEQEGLVKKFKLTSNLSTNNMHLFDENKKITRYESSTQILEKVFPLMLGHYKKRKEKCLEMYESEIVKLDNQIRFTKEMLEIMSLDFDTMDLLVRELDGGHYCRFVNNEPLAKTREDSKKNDDKHLGFGGYDYLLQMPLSSFTAEGRKQLQIRLDETKMKKKDLLEHTERTLWLRDLEALENALKEREKKEEEDAKKDEEEAKDQSVRKQKKEVVRKNNRNATKANPVKESSSLSVPVTEPAPEQAKAKGRAGPKKANRR